MSRVPARLGSRALFPSLSARAYLAHAAISPVSAPAQALMHQVLEDYAKLGMGAFMKWHERREVLRARSAQLLETAPACIGLCHNTSHGIRSVALGFPYAPGDRIVVLRGEFPGNVTPWQVAAQRFGCELVWLDVEAFDGDAAQGLSELEGVLRQGAAIMAYSAVQFQTGLRMPMAAIAALCRAHECAVFVDGIQAAGAVPLDLRHCDFLAAGGHKWLMGVEGTGLLYVAPQWAGRLSPMTAGWLSHEAPVDFLFEPGRLRYDKPFRPGADFVEAGAYNTVGLAALEIGVSLVLEAGGPAAIFEHVDAYLDRVESVVAGSGWTSLRHAEKARRSGIGSFRPPPGIDVATAAAQLEAQGFVLSTPDGCLRVAPHWPNALDEAPGVGAAIRAL